MNKFTAGLTGALIIALTSASMAGPVNVNTADANTLANELNGIGHARARAIVAWRLEHGRFDSVEDLQNVKGVGTKIIRMNQGNILFDDPRAESD
ncbi:MAG: helix-hairpin-helix domain-containing protein [Gammaproteobacteria bacterium]|nr:helix-hairpin-helix domain-containing protein [Gammaproteobacteria bacterium]MDH3767936.1 helix-hairpin-helix domain-containing protein [Gammaproteobacteria bacterium]